jgi:phosphoribosylglycinamide formyltransferase-1
MDDMVNLLVDLRADRFGSDMLSRALREIENAGFEVERVTTGSDVFHAWIDEQFGGTWSSEAFSGSSVIAKCDSGFAGFATYAPEGLRFAWLRGVATQKGVGIFGPFGVAQEFRGCVLGPQLLLAALSSLKQAGYTQALIPAVGAEKLAGYYEKHCGARVVEKFSKAQWHSRKYRTVVLASGNGTNFQAVLDGVQAGNLPLDVTMLLCNNANAVVLERARAMNVHAVILPWERKTQSREQYDEALLGAVEREQPELVLLLGWMHLLPSAFIDAFAHIINIHPAFLPLDQHRNEVAFPDGSVAPAFRGPRAVDDALTFGSRWVGASSHRVTLETDAGPVLVRRPLRLADGQAKAMIMQRLHPLEHRVLAGGIMRWVYER